MYNHCRIRIGIYYEQEVTQVSKCSVPRCGSHQITLGAVMICDFEHLEVPEITKTRPVIVIAVGAAEDRLFTVTPLSTTPPRRVKGFHHLMSEQSLPYPWRDVNRRIFAKCNILHSVSSRRLEPIRVGSFWYWFKVSDMELNALLRAVAVGLNLFPLVNDDLARTAGGVRHGKSSRPVPARLPPHQSGVRPKELDFVAAT